MMKSIILKNYLNSYKYIENPKKIEETVAECRRITEERAVLNRKRSNYLEFLSEVFRMNGPMILLGQMATLVMICLFIQFINDYPRLIPVCTPLFILVALPALFEAEISKMSEIELATRNSCAQLLLARLVIIGASDIICFTLLLIVELYCFHTGQGILNLILYVFVPYMACVTMILRLIRSGRRRLRNSAGTAALTSIIFGMVALVIPGLYKASSVGIWLICFLIFGSFFIREMGYLISLVKEGKTYGFVD